MQQPEKVRARLQSVDDTLARLRDERSSLLARASQAERKRDTRRKVLIGGAVVAAIAHEGVPAIRTSEKLLAWLDPRLTAHTIAVFDLKS